MVLQNGTAMTESLTIDIKIIEVLKHKDNRFQLIQRSAFNNANPKGANLTAFKQWCRAKDIISQRG